MADLTGPLAKFNRAVAHAECFDGVLQGFVDGQPYGVSFNYDAETGWNELCWDVRREAPLETFAVIFGDILYNLRASLDYLVWQLVCAAGNVPDKDTAFPVVKRQEDWTRDRTQARVRGVGDPWLGEIHALQPYHRADRPEIHPLAILDEVNNINKHRFLPASVVGLREFGFELGVEEIADGEGVQIDNRIGQPVEHGAPFLRFRPESGSKLDVRMDQAPSVRILFADGLDHRWNIPELIEWVWDTLTRFEPAFTS